MDREVGSEKNMKTPMKIISFTVIGIVLVAAGFISGINIAATSESQLDDNLSKLTSRFYVLQKIEENDTEEAKAWLNMQLHGSIYAVGNILPYCQNKEKAHTAKVLLSGIAQFREDHPYSGSDEQIDKQVQEILNIASTEIKTEQGGGEGLR